MPQKTPAESIDTTKLDIDRFNWSDNLTIRISSLFINREQGPLSNRASFESEFNSGLYTAALP